MTIEIQPDLYFGRWFHASASDFDPESPIGSGDTPEAAIVALWEMIEEGEQG